MMFRRAERSVPLQSTFPKVLPSAERGFGKERSVLLPVAPMEDMAAELQLQ